MSIGGTLAEARQAAGLTVADISARTRIRGGLIRAIEHDDFRVCGGDFYARGHIRAIARVVGVDSGPLIAAYDAVLPDARPSAAVEDTVEDLLLPPAVTREPLPPAPSPHDHQAGVHQAHGHRPRGHRAPAHRAGGQPRREARDRGRRLLWLPAPLAPLAPLAVVALAVIGGGAYQLAAGTGSRHTGTPVAGTSSPPRSPSADRSVPTATAPPTAVTVPSSAPPAPAEQIKPSSVTAYGPGGTSDGDNPSSASQALSGDPGSPWRSEWYTSASFGNLKHGTGLLFTLPRAVTATAVTIWLGFPGATVQVRAGTSQGSLSTVASASNAGRTVRLPLASQPLVRYLVVWFTRLAPDGNGTYQAAVYGVTVTAAPAA